MLTVYKSSAGSGKTFTLVKEYLGICLSTPSDFSKILAITFTNKASAEMKERIIASIHQFLNEGNNEIIDELIEARGLNKSVVQQKCENLRGLLLHSYSKFSVMTIDSFISRVVKTFAYDLDMPLKFEVELDTDYMFNEIIENLLATADKDNFVGDILTQFSLSKIYSSGSWHLDNELKKIGKVTFNEKYIEPVLEISSDQYDDDFWKELINELEKEVSRFRKRVNSLAARALEIIEKNGLTIDDFSHKKSGPAGALENYKYASTLDDFEIKKRLERGEWVTKKYEQQNPEKFIKIQKVLEQGVRDYSHELIKYIKNNQVEFTSNYLVLKNIYSEALIKKFLDLTKAFKKDTNKIPLLDFSLKVAEIIKKESVPFLYWRLGDTFRHIMIDEFQDTSFLQWINLLPLFEESLSTGNFNMVVGDGKQAIYRWRAGDVRIMEKEIKEEFKSNIQTKILQNNFRSAKEIVCFNNELFSNIKERLDIDDDELLDRIYSEKFIQQNPVTLREGYIKIVGLSLKKHKKEKRNEIKLQQLSEEIQGILNEHKGYDYGDIAVLVRKNKECDAVAQYLSEQEIPVMSPDSFLLKTSSAVRFLISALEYISRDDHIALLNMWLFRGNDPGEFKCNNSNYIDSNYIEQELSPEFREKKLVLYHLPVYETVEEIIRIFNLNKDNPGYLQGFLEVVFDYSGKFDSDIHGFLEWWDEYNDSEKTTLPMTEPKNAVRISTIHKAKGLEFPIVFLPFDWKMFETSSGYKQHMLWVKSDKIGKEMQDFPFLVDVQKDMEDSIFKEDYEEEKKMSILDSINLLYVALTRARDRLYILFETGNTSNSNTSAGLIEQSVKEMDLNRISQIWTKGKPEEKEKPEKKCKPDLLENISTHSWRHKIAVRKRSHDLWTLKGKEQNKKVEWGILMHSILSEIRTVNDIDQAVEDKYREGHLSLPEKKKIRRNIRGLMKLEYTQGTVEDWFQPQLKIMNEQSIITQEQEYRPDRVIIDKNRIIIVDYKTGVKESEHAVQLARYSTLLEKMGYKNIEKYILYLNAGLVEEV